MRLKNYIIGAGITAGAVLASIPIGDAMFRGLLGKTEVRNTRITSVEDYCVSNDFGMCFSGQIVECDSLESEIQLSSSDLNGRQMHVGDVVDLTAYKKIPVFGHDRGYDVISIQRTN